jgi:hypothetical protein
LVPVYSADEGIAMGEDFVAMAENDPSVVIVLDTTSRPLN